jgi:hypothetical protein
LETAPRSEAGFPEGAVQADGRLLKAARKDLLVFLGILYGLFAKAGSESAHSVRPIWLLSALGWVQVEERYVPGKPSVLRSALGIVGKATEAARESGERCGALAGSFREGADTLRRLTGMDVSVSKLRAMTLAFGETCVAVQKAPPPDVREYASRPSQAYQAVDRTLFCMVDGGSAPCCKVDTQDVEGKNGEAGTRQIRVGLFGEYGWLDRKGHPTPWEDSLSYFVSGENIAIFTPILKLHGVSRGSGTVSRMLCLCDGEPALEIALRDAFPHAVFANDFYHASEHLHDCCFALGLDEAAAGKEYRFCRGLLYRLGAESAAKRIRRLYPERLNALEQAVGELLYLEKRKDNMRYGWLRRNGYYIGSGHVEAAVRVLVVRRCKQAGMHWRHVNAIRISAIHAHYRSHTKSS